MIREYRTLEIKGGNPQHADLDLALLGTCGGWTTKERN
jgi:hypothetical protein